MQKQSFFIGVGVPKAGTTWLHHALSQHPNVWLPPHKELRYFNRPDDERSVHHRNIRRDALARAVEKASRWDDPNRANSHIDWFKDYAYPPEGETLEWYKSLFRPNAKHLAYGEITPGYASLPQSEYQHIKDAFPDVRIFVIFRDPVDRIISNLRFRFGRGHKHLKEAFENEASFKEVASDAAYRSYSSYDTIVQNLDAVFEQKNLHFMYYEDLFKGDTQKEMDKLYSFIGVPSSEHFKAGFSANKSPKSEFKFDARRAISDDYEHVISFMEERFGRVPDSWMK